MKILTRTLLLLLLITTATRTGDSRWCTVQITCNNMIPPMNDPQRCTARFNMKNRCSNFGSHVQFDYASSRFNCTICQSNMCPCTVLTANTSINKSSCSKVTNTPSCNCITTGITDVFSSNITPMITSTGPVADTLPATLHGVYMTVLLVLVAVTITMTTLVVYMCLMMRRAKSGRVPQTTTGTTTTNNMAASDYLEPISLNYMQTTGTENGNSCSDRVPDSADTTTGTPHNNMAASNYGESVTVRRDKEIANSTYGTVEPATQGTTLIQDHTYGHLSHHTHPPILDPPTSDNTVYNELTNTHKATPQGGGHEYETVDEVRKDNTTGEVNGEERKERHNKESL